jgi:putative phage-type endonuclease
MTTTLEPKFVCPANGPEWLQRRNEGLGASEAAAACGVSEWSTPLEVYYRKRGELPPIEENFAMRFGKFAEPFIEQEFEAKSGLRIIERQPGLFQHPEDLHVLASPDGITEDAEVGFEGKTINGLRAAKLLGEEYTDEAPVEWNLQCQQQMLVMGWRSVWIAALVGGAELRIYEIQRNEKLIQNLRRKLADLWGRIKSGNPPEWSEHRSNLQVVRDLYGEVQTGGIIELSDDAAAAWSGYEARNETIKTLKSEADNLKARVLYEVGENEAGLLPDGRYVRRKEVQRKGYTVEPSSYIDVRAVAAKVYG